MSRDVGNCIPSCKEVTYHISGTSAIFPGKMSLTGDTIWLLLGDEISRKYSVNYIR